MDLGNRLGLLFAKQYCGPDCVAKEGIGKLFLGVLSNLHTMPACVHFSLSPRIAEAVIATIGRVRILAMPE